MARSNTVRALASFAATMTAAIRERSGGIVRESILRAAQQYVAWREALHRGEEPSIRRAEGKRDARFGARRHQMRAAADIVAECEDPIEIVKRNAEQGLSVLPYIYRGPVLREISAIPRDKECI